MRLNEALQQLPGTELRASVLIQPLVQARQIMVFGKADKREMVRKLIKEIDIEPGELEQKVFDLEHTDPEQIKENLDSLYGEVRPTGISDYYWLRYGRGQQSPSEVVKVIAFPTMQQVTVIASPVNMRKIEKQIEEWDVALDVEKVKPLILTLHNSDPVQMADLMTKLFSESSGSGSDMWDIFFYPRRGAEDKKKIVGPLYGQLTFEPVPDTKKIIVISKMPEAYKVIKELILDLDKEEMAEVPKVITLKYADPEDLAERLNAIFNEPGTTAIIRRSDRGLSDYSMEEDSGSSGSGQSGQDDTTSQEDYRPWWTTGRQSIDEMPMSNVIGRVRFIPDPRTKSILVLAPPEFMENIGKMITELDIPGKQVMIKAVIMQINHSDVTSLGLQLKTGSFDESENAISISNALSFLDEHGALVFGEKGGGMSFDISAGLSVNAMIDFLVKKTNAKILNQQSLWTKDNEEAMFFKGKNVPFQTDSTTYQTGQSTTASYEYEKVGMTLRIRPSITPENNVDMIINVILSQLTAETVNQQIIRTEMDTTTNMIVQHAQTLMLGGILFQTDSKVERKIPLLGDMPVAGGLFRHNSVEESNEELIVFITPYVIDEPNDMLPETLAEIEEPLEKLGDIQEELKMLLQPEEWPDNN
jgi:type II secretion system protein D